MLPRAHPFPLIRRQITGPTLSASCSWTTQPARLLSYEAVLSGLGVNCVRSLSGEEALVRVLKQGQDLQRAQEEGFAVHLVKPVDGMQLNEAIAPAQEQRRWSS